MNIPNYNILIRHDKYDVILNETFVNDIQFKLFIKMVQGCIELKNDLTFFNGTDFFIHIPHRHLVESIITTKIDTYNLVDHMVNKSKIEALKTKDSIRKDKEEINIFSV
jgi:hypothetical protein